MTDPKIPPKRLDDLTDEELADELARRRAAKLAQAGMWAAEEAVEKHAHEDQRRSLERVVAERSRAQTSDPKPCPRCGLPAGVKAANRRRTVRTMSGEMTFCRHYHYCERCRSGFYPLDHELGLADSGEVSPKMMARVLDFGVTMPFEEAAARWSVHHSGISVSENLVRCVTQRAGEAMERLEPAERHEAVRQAPTEGAALLVVQADGSMLPMREQGEWREAKLGIVYRSDEHLPCQADQRGQLTAPRYATSMRGIDDFRGELDHAMRAERAEQATTVAWIGDGAPWIWNLREELSPNGVEVLDFMHMKEHAADCGKEVLGADSPWLPLWIESIADRIERGRIDEVLGELDEIRPLLRGARREAVSNLHRYFTTHAHRMNYPAFRQAGLPIGSGAIESSHRRVLQTRMKLAGQHWSHEGAHRMAQLRAAYHTAGPERFADVAVSMAA